MRKSSIRFYVIVVILAAFISASCSKKQEAPDESGEARRPDPVSVILGIMPYMSNAVFHIGIEEGYFADEGLLIERISARSSNEVITGLVSGEIDIGAPTIHPAFFNVIAKGASIRFVLPLTEFNDSACAYIGFLARQSDIDAGTYSSPSQWKDAWITSSTAKTFSTPDYVTDVALQTVGLDLEDVNLKLISLPVQAEALKSGQVDLVFAVEPWITRMTASEEIGLLMPVESFVNGLTASLVSYGRKVLENPEIGERFAVAYLKAARKYMEGKTPRNVQLISDFTGLEKELVERVCWSYVSVDGDINIDLIMENQRWLNEHGLIDQLLQPEQFLDTRFREFARKAARK